jgi:hypothetical protein
MTLPTPPGQQAHPAPSPPGLSWNPCFETSTFTSARVQTACVQGPAAAGGTVPSRLACCQEACVVVGGRGGTTGLLTILWIGGVGAAKLVEGHR